MAGVGAGGSADLEALRRAAIVPQILRSAPRSCSLRVRYGTGERSADIVPGSRVPTRRTSSPPDVAFPDVPSGEPGYTLLKFDPDTPFGGNFLHWLVVNAGTPEQFVAAKYTGAGAPANTGLHRYIFVLFRQTKVLRRSEVRASKTVQIDRLVADLALEPHPVNSNFYVAKFDCSPFTCCTTMLLCSWLCCCCTPSDDFAARKGAR